MQGVYRFNKEPGLSNQKNLKTSALNKHPEKEKIRIFRGRREDLEGGRAHESSWSWVVDCTRVGMSQAVEAAQVKAKVGTVACRRGGRKGYP